MLRELRPGAAVFENVPGLFSSDGGRFFNRVLRDIETSHYECYWSRLSASDFGAPHLRERIWIIAWNGKEGRSILDSLFGE
jgi:DNA (cytosine-5)-methyltransferase 1